MKRHFIKRPGALVPASEEAEKWLTGLKIGTLIEVEAKQPRNAKLHKKWWSLCNYLAEHSSRFPTSEHASKYILIQLGYCVWFQPPKRPGFRVTKTVPIADSISFARMTDDEFSTMYSKAMDLICEILPNVTDKDVAQVLAEYAGVGWMMEQEASVRALTK